MAFCSSRQTDRRSNRMVGHGTVTVTVTMTPVRLQSAVCSLQHMW